MGKYTAPASSGGSGGDVVDDTTPQLGGTLDANGNTIDMGTNTITDTKVGQWDTAFAWGNHGSAGYISNLVEDTSPQLGGNLDLNSQDITGSGDISITGAFNAPQLPTVSVTTGTVNMTKATHAGRYVLFSGGTLALPASFAVGEHYTVINTTSAGRSVSAASGDTINGGAGGGSVTVPAYGSVTFVGVVANTTWVGLGV